MLDVLFLKMLVVQDKTQNIPYDSEQIVSLQRKHMHVLNSI